MESSEDEKGLDFLWQVFRPLVIIVLVGSSLWLAVNPPSFSGIPALLVVFSVALTFALGTAWIVTRLTSQEMDEPTWERIVNRSEMLAKLPPPEAPPSAFEQLVLEAIDELPLQFRKVLARLPVTVSREGYKRRAYGLYVGATVFRDTYPDHIVIFEDTLLRDFGWDEEVLRSQVRRVLQHELAHHLGWNESGVRQLGL